MSPPGLPQLIPALFTGGSAGGGQVGTVAWARCVSCPHGSPELEREQALEKEQPGVWGRESLVHSPGATVHDITCPATHR